MAANLLQHHLADSDFTITLIESPQIGIIGVGEGSTPQLKLLFKTLNIPESEWMTACNATYKVGINFVDWTQHAQNNAYFHPFPSPLDRQTAGAFLHQCEQRRKGVDVATSPNDFFLSAALAKQALSPRTQAQFAQVPLNYAYHFDSVLLGEFLRDKALQKGVQHIAAKMLDIDYTQSGNIHALQLDDGACIEGDFFIDCSGFNSELLQQGLGVAFDSFANNLFNDSAIACPTDAKHPIPSDTTATALKHGWAWHIPLTNRVGNGYVFSQRYCSFEQAEHELAEHLGKSVQQLKFKRLNMKVGQVQQHWHKNVIALGLSQGFIEPLEATADRKSVV